MAGPEHANQAVAAKTPFLKHMQDVVASCQSTKAHPADQCLFVFACDCIHAMTSEGCIRARKTLARLNLNQNQNHLAHWVRTASTIDFSKSSKIPAYPSFYDVAHKLDKYAWVLTDGGNAALGHAIHMFLPEVMGPRYDRLQCLLHRQPF